MDSHSGQRASSREAHHWPPWLGVATAAIFLALSLFQLAVPPIVGLADNGDYWRIRSTVGLEYPPGASQTREYVHRYYQTVRPREAGYFSSQNLIVAAAVSLCRLFQDDDSFDLVALGVLQATLLALAVGLVTFQLAARSALLGVGGGLSLCLVVADTTHIAILNSLYTEPSGLIGLLFLAAATLGLGRLHGPRAARTAYLLLYYSALSLLCLSKLQYIPLSVPLAIVPWLILRREGLPLKAAAGVLAIVALFLTFHDSSSRIPRDLRRANLYNLVFSDILPLSDNPGGTIRELGLSEHYLRLSGTVAFGEKTGSRDPDLRRELDSLGRAGLLAFLARHPSYLLSILAGPRVSRQLWISRLGNLGNFTMEAGRGPRAQSHAFTWWSSLRYRALGSQPLWLVPLLGLNIGLAGWGLRWSWGTELEALFWLQAVLLVTAAGQLAVCIVGDGSYEFGKHYFLGRLAGDLLWLFLAGSGVRLLRRVGPGKPFRFRLPRF